MIVYLVSSCQAFHISSNNYVLPFTAWLSITGMTINNIVYPAYSQDNKSIKKKRRDKRNRKMVKSKTSLLGRIRNEVIVPDDFTPQNSCDFKHHREGPVILTAAMSHHLGGHDVKRFVGTARMVGFNDDIVVAISPNSRLDLQSRYDDFNDNLIKYKAITYLVAPICNDPKSYYGLRCHFQFRNERTADVSINMLRYYLYLWWTIKYYDKNALVMIADFTDSFFQSNPFLYHTNEWKSPKVDLVVFQEAYPNKVIYRCSFNSGWIEMCYTREDYEAIKSNTVSCSGISMGTSEGILMYSFLLTEQLKPNVRYGNAYLINAEANANASTINMTRRHELCHSALGVDQGYHNYLVYSGQLSTYLNVKIYQQGEGPANSIGGFFGMSNINQMNLTLREMKILRGDETKAAFYNFNGEVSPIVHQYDRFRGTQYNEDRSFSVFQGLE